MTIERDIALAFRQLRRSPIFGATVVVTLALALGPLLAVIRVADAVSHRSLGVDRPDRLFRVNFAHERGGSPRPLMSFPDFITLQTNPTRAINAQAAFATRPVALDALNSDSVLATFVSRDFFALAGVHPLRGRFFRPEEVEPPLGAQVAIVGERFWRDAFALDSGVLGRGLILNGRRFEIIGIVPERFSGFRRDAITSVFLPLGSFDVANDMDGALSERDARLLTVLVRVETRPNETAFIGHLQTLARQLAAAFPSTNAGIVFGIQPLEDARTSSAVWVGIAVLTVLIVLIASANLAGLFIARAATRRRDIAIRASLGASRARLGAMLLVEPILLTGLGASLGLALTSWLSIALHRANLGLVVDAFPGWRTMAAAAGLSVCAAAVFGGLAVQQALSSVSWAALRAGVVGDESGRPKKWRVDIAVQIAVAACLLIVAVGFARSLMLLTRASVGFDVEHLLAVEIAFPPDRDTAVVQRRRAALSGVVQRVREIPVVRASAIGSDLLLVGWDWDGLPFSVPGYVPRLDERLAAPTSLIGTQYFRTLGIDVLSGREFDDGDVSGNTRSIIVTDALARRFWPPGMAVGRTLLLARDKTPRIVIGVVANAHEMDVRSERIERIYVPVKSPGGWLYVRTSGTPAGAWAQVRRELERLGADVAMRARLRMMSDQRDAINRPHRLAAVVVAGVAGFAALAAMLGLYGFMSYVVSTRMREIGIRAALGARPLELAALVARDVLRLGGIGALIGVVLAFGTSRVLSQFYYGTNALDPAVILAAASALLVALAAGAAVPAIRASRANPGAVLRAD